MDCKVCTKCEKEKELSQFTKQKAACKKCIYDLYTRPNVLRRLAKQGKLPKALQPRKSKQHKLAVIAKNQRDFQARKKANTPPPIPKVRWATKPPVIRPRMSDTMSAEEMAEHRRKVKREYRKVSPKHKEQLSRDYRAARSRPETKIAKNIRKRLKEFLKPGKRLGSFDKMVGCTKEQLLQHLEGQFTEGMTWDNYGFTGWHIDHIRPLASFNLQDESTWCQINHYTNLRPMWAIENMGKANYWNGVKWEKGKPVGDT